MKKLDIQATCFVCKVNNTIELQKTPEMPNMPPDEMILIAYGLIIEIQSTIHLFECLSYK